MDCVQTPGGCWVHFSEVEIDGFRALDPGQEVDFEWQKTSGPVEGFAFMATQARPVQAENDR
ncbi:cold-shock protein [Rhodococcus sp. HNM0563]|nr:cold-shock protein [Rhodococcus sp. HNM0563]